MAQEEALTELKAAMKVWHEAIEKFESVAKPETVGTDGWIEDDHDVMFDLETEFADDE